MTSYITEAEVRALWRDAPPDDVVLDIYIDAAVTAVLAYAPDQSPFTTPVSPSIKLAVVMQARNIYNAGKASSGGDLDGSGFGITTMPLDWQVKQLIRPRRALGAIA